VKLLQALPLHVSDGTSQSNCNSVGRMGSMSRTFKLTLVGLGTVAGAFFLVTAAYWIGVFHLGQPSRASTEVVASASPASKQGNANQVAKVQRQSVIQAESQVLGIPSKDLNANLRRGRTVHQMADERGISQTDFQQRFSQALKALLDQAVQQGTVTSHQEQQMLKRIGTRIPNWDPAGQAA
jgi:hypothetical protein